MWLPALLQHYGPGSYFLDVTKDLEVALWFATHRLFSKASATALFVHGTTTSVVINWAWYESIQSIENGDFEPVIYVFDVFRWPGFGKPGHGDLVAVKNLAMGQRLLHRATRLERQDAYLLYASPQAILGPDLRGVLRAVISLPRKSRDEPTANWKTSDLFPPPAADPCYAALLMVPLLSDSALSQYIHPLRIPCYITSYEATVDRDGEIVDFVSRLHAAG